MKMDETSPLPGIVLSKSPNSSNQEVHLIPEAGFRCQSRRSFMVLKHLISISETYPST